MNFQKMQLSILILDPLAEELYENALKDEEKNNPYNTDSGFDLFFIEDVIVPGGETKRINLGISCEAKFYGESGSNQFLRGTGFDIVPRSSISKTPLRMANSIGIIDAEYRGALQVAVDNISEDDYTIRRGHRLFQIVSPNRVRPKVKIVKGLSKTSRGTGGYGSTGL